MVCVLKVKGIIPNMIIVFCVESCPGKHVLCYCRYDVFRFNVNSKFLHQKYKRYDIGHCFEHYSSYFVKISFMTIIIWHEN